MSSRFVKNGDILPTYHNCFEGDRVGEFKEMLEEEDEFAGLGYDHVEFRQKALEAAKRYPEGTCPKIVAHLEKWLRKAGQEV